MSIFRVLKIRLNSLVWHTYDLSGIYDDRNVMRGETVKSDGLYVKQNAL